MYAVPWHRCLYRCQLYPTSIALMVSQFLICLYVDTCTCLFLYLYMCKCTCICPFISLLFCVFFHCSCLSSFTSESFSFLPLVLSIGQCTEVAQLQDCQFACYRQHDDHHEVEIEGSAQSSSCFMGIRNDGVKPKARVGSNPAANRKGGGKVLIVARPMQHRK